MRRFFASKYAFLLVLALFASAFSWNLAHGAGTVFGGHILLPDMLLTAHGPTLPPDPWDGVQIAG